MRTLTFNYLTVEALGVFKDARTIYLTPTDDRNVILVEGMNGSGKTTFLQSLQIALFGSKALGLKKAEYEKLISEWRRADILLPPRIEAEIKLSDGDTSDTYRVIREWTFTAKKMRESFTVFKNKLLTSISSSDWDELIDDYLPVDLAELFFFDGEKIEQMANPSRMPEILGKAIESLLGMGEIDELATDLSAYERRSLLKAKSDNGGIDEDVASLKGITAELESIEEGLERCSVTQASCTNRLAIAEKHLEEVSQHAEKQGLSAYKKSIELNSQLAGLTTNLNEAKRARLDLIADPLYPLTIGKNLLKDLLERKAEESSHIDSTFLMEILDIRDKRMIKTLVTLIPDHKSDIEKIFQAEAEELKTKAGQPSYLQPMESATVIEERLNFINEKKLQITRQITQLDEKILSLQGQIASIPQAEKVELLQTQVATAQLKVGEIEEEIKVCKEEESRLTTLKARLTVRSENLENRLRESYRDDERTRYALDASKRVRSILQAYKKELLAQKTAWLAEAICHHFNELARKKNFIHKVAINPETYEVTLYQDKGTILQIDRLSAGERQLLATALLRALMSANNSQLPVVVDTPLARLDGAHRMKLVQNFYKKVSHQVMILSTDEEISGDLRIEIDKSLSHAYGFVFNEELQGTEVNGE